MNGSSAQFNAIVTIVGSVLLFAFAPPEVGLATAFTREAPSLILGIVLGLVGATAGATAIWLVAGGKPSVLHVGLGAARWMWMTRSGTLLTLARIPLAVGFWGISRWAPLCRLPFVAVLVAAAAVLVRGVLAMDSGLPTAGWGWTFSTMLVAVGYLLPWQPPGCWAAAFGRVPDHDTAHLWDRIRRAYLLRDDETVLALTDPMPEPSDETTRSSRAYALSRTGRHDEAIALARAEIGDGVPLFMHQLALLRHTAMEAGDPAGIAARHELDQLAEALDDPVVPNMLRWDVEAVAALAHGDYDGAEQLATSIIARVPRRHRAHAWCTIARAQAGMARFDEARKSLAHARKDDPGEPRIPYAEAAVARVESGEDLTAASH